MKSGFFSGRGGPLSDLVTAAHSMLGVGMAAVCVSSDLLGRVVASAARRKRRWHRKRGGGDI